MYIYTISACKYDIEQGHLHVGFDLMRTLNAQYVITATRGSLSQSDTKDVSTVVRDHGSSFNFVKQD